MENEGYEYDEIELPQLAPNSQETPEIEDINPRPKFLQKIGAIIDNFNERHSGLFWNGLVGLLAAAYHIYLGLAVAHDFHQAIPLVVLTSLFWIGILYYKIFLPLLGPAIEERIFLPLSKLFDVVWSKIFIRIPIYLLLVAAVLSFLIWDTSDNRWRLLSGSGLLVFLFLLWIFSESPWQVNWRPVFWGLTLQFLLGLAVLRWSVGNAAFDWLGNQFAAFLSYTQNGTSFVYGFLVTPPNICGLSPVFAFSVLQTILYVCSVIAILYYFGIMQFVVKRLAWIMSFTMGTTGPESLCAAASIFIGTIEAPLSIRPYMLRLTKSEWFAIMTAGLSTIAGSVFAIYISFGACSVHLLAASVMSAPAALAVAKLFCPETEESQLKRVDDLELEKGEEKTVIEAVVNGANQAMGIVASVIATLIVFLALLAFFDTSLMWLGGLVGVQNLTFTKLMSWIFFPFAFLMGASDLSDPEARTQDLLKVSELMGMKLFLNEFIAYKKLGSYIAAGTISERAQVVATYALCGFSNIGAMGMALGGLGSLCPERKSLLAGIALRALVAANVACAMTACMAGLLSSEVKSCGAALNSTQQHCFAIK